MRYGLFLLLALSSCASLGRYPGESDVSCLRRQMAPPMSDTFIGAVGSGCQTIVEDAPTVAHAVPLNLRGAPDLQAQARQWGVPYTD